MLKQFLVQKKARIVPLFAIVLLSLLMLCSSVYAQDVSTQEIELEMMETEAQILQDATVGPYLSIPYAEAELMSDVPEPEPTVSDDEVGMIFSAAAPLDKVRIMMLGDGLTRGVGASSSSDRMGYRAYVQRAWKAAGIDYTLVGSQTNYGNRYKYDILHEGHSTWRIEAVKNGIVKLLAQKNSTLAANPPDIVMLSAGMQDITGNYKLDSAMARYEALLDTLRNGLTGTKIAVSTVIDSTNATYQKRILAFNESLRELVAEQAAIYHDVVLVEFSGALTKGQDYYTATNPNDKGYAKLAIIWNKALSTMINHPNAAKLATPPLRVMPLGASVTYGMGSSTANANAGYRGYLQYYFDDAGVSYDMVGSNRRGNQNLIDTDNEGHSGYRIDQIASRLTQWLTNNPPDVVTLHIGGNDVFQNYRLAEAPQRLNALIDQIRDKSPQGVKIVVFTLLDTSDKNYQQRVHDYNAALRVVVANQFAAHSDVWLAEMEGMIDIKTELSDRQHPNAKGYAKMAVSCAYALSNFMPEMNALVQTW